MIQFLLALLFFPLAVFALFTWKWWETQWKGGVFRKTLFLTLFPLYGTLFIILNFTHS
jgi:hypothetical protein